MRKRIILITLLLMLGAFGTHLTQAQRREVVNIYSSRHYGVMESAYVTFTEETGIEVRISQGTAQSLLQRLEAEGEETPADVLFTADVGTLDLAAEEGLLQPIDSEILQQNIPEDLRDPENRWFAVGQRFRTIVYNSEYVNPDELSTYAALADPEWKDRLCLRPATHVYTLSLVSSMIAELGTDETEKILQSWVDNDPQYIDGDETILKTVEAGGCDVGLVNHYYYATLLNENPDTPVRLFWANQDENGVHRNVSGVGVTTYAVNVDNAIALLEWMSDQGQAADETGIPGGIFEYPVNPDAPLSPILEQFGEFKIDPFPLSEYGDYQADAIDLLEQVNYGF